MSAAKTQRNNDIYARLMNGESQKSIAQFYGISGERVRQLYCKKLKKDRLTANTQLQQPALTEVHAAPAHRRESTD
jgi:DNA-binding CsgD family transcriptional regulator